MRVPGFLVRRFYVQGSLCNTESGFQLQAHNEMGNGMLVGVTRIKVDGVEIDRQRIHATREGMEGSVCAADISRGSPVPVERGTRVTLEVHGTPLTPGKHHLEVELVERDLGTIQLSITEAVAERPSIAPAAPV